MSTQPPGPKRDPYGLGFIALLIIALVVGIALAVRALLATDTSPPTERPSVQDTLATLGAKLHGAVRNLATQLQKGTVDPPAAPQPRASPPAPAPAGNRNDPARAYPGLAAGQLPSAPQVVPVAVDATWTYDVFFGTAWTKIGQLRYKTMRQAQGQTGADMSWLPNGAQQPTTWFLGTFAANHPSHANTRFPGFFMHAAYLPDKLEIGQRLRWEFPWQGGAPAQQSVRVRRYELTVAGWERVTVPAGEFDAARMDGTLRYVDGDSVKAEIRYSLWYAPRAKQVVRLLWMGRAPDESSAEMIAELAAYRGP